MKRSRSTELWSRHNVPDELWPEILSRLPAKSLLHFRSVSHTWRAFIDNPAFARSHLTRFKNNRNESHLFVLQRNFHQDDCVVRCSHTFRVTARHGALNYFDLPVEISPDLLPFPHGSQRWYIVGSIDGVFILWNAVYAENIQDPGTEWMLWNPSIRKVRMLPPPPEYQHESPEAIIDVGLGFDPSINDYKHIRFHMGDKDALVSIAIYTFGTDSWKEISLEGDWCWDTTLLHYARTIVCFRGVLYLLLRNWESDLFEVVSFHLSSEEFASASLPVDQDINYDDIDPLLTLADGGSSVAVVFIGINQGSIWMWDGIGGDTEAMAWSKRYTFASRIPDEYPSDDAVITFVYLKSNGELILEWFNSMVTYYNLETHTEKVVLKFKGSFMDIGGAFVHIENLMLLN